ncbi:hypothetical protein ACQ4LE_006787 [Meloidogyne hapla]|uniref:GPS domain-containing protein n=1 Tax=Meloidogyne hapla TaxID=6305 RepID=A0A1I8BA32_MELHA
MDPTTPASTTTATPSTSTTAGTAIATTSTSTPASTMTATPLTTPASTTTATPSTSTTAGTAIATTSTSTPASTMTATPLTTPASTTTATPSTSTTAGTAIATTSTSTPASTMTATPLTTPASTTTATPSTTTTTQIALAHAAEAVLFTQISLIEVSRHFDAANNTDLPLDTAEATLLAATATSEMADVVSISSHTTSRVAQANLPGQANLVEASSLIGQSIEALTRAFVATVETIRGVVNVVVWPWLVTENTTNTITHCGSEATTSSSEAALRVATALNLLADSASEGDNEFLARAIRQNSNAMLNTAIAASTTANISTMTANLARVAPLGIPTDEIRLERELIETNQQLVLDVQRESDVSIQLAERAVQAMTRQNNPDPN